MKRQTDSRRSFLKRSAGLLAGLAVMPQVGVAGGHPIGMDEAPLEVHVFSKHLQFLDYPALARAVREMGFAGVDLTVRTGGHVAPGRVATELPAVVDALRAEGLAPCMMTTAVVDASDPESRQVLETAARLGFSAYRMGWLQYPEEGSVRHALAALAGRMQALAAFNVELGLAGSYQNHSGPYVGASLWEVDALLQHANPRGLGCQYDIRHAVVEGGLSWPTGLRLILPRINTLVLKDFIWKEIDGRWRVVNTPLGEGMVDFTSYFRMLKSYGLRVPVSLHLEYDLGGAEQGRREIDVDPEVVFAAMRRDLETARRLWRAA